LQTRLTLRTVCRFTLRSAATTLMLIRPVLRRLDTRASARKRRAVDEDAHLFAQMPLDPAERPAEMPFGVLDVRPDLKPGRHMHFHIGGAQHGFAGQPGDLRRL